MKHWQVRAAKNDGSIEELSITANNEIAAAKQIRAKGFTPLSIRAGNKPRQKKIRGASIAATRLIREISALIGAGLPVEKALSSLAKFSDKSLTGTIAKGLLKDIRAGNSLSQAFEKMPDFFPPPFAQIAEAGEASSSLAEALGDLANWREQQQKFEAEIRGSLLYPIILLVFSALAVIGILVFIVPIFEKIFVDMQAVPPAFTGFVFATSRNLVLWGPGLLASIVIFSFIVGWWLRRPNSGLTVYRILHNSPISGKIIKPLLAAKFCRVLAVLLQNGLSAAPAFRLASASLTDLFARQQLQKALEEVRRGSSLPEQISKAAVLPPLASEILRVGEETADLAPAAKRLAQMYEEQLQRATKQIMNVAEPLLIGFVGLVIGAIILSIMMAMVSITQIEY
ncbi:MAG: type II secretion system F family protein [Robiginitomaculum sp.]|nr:type II secretion system F family protein [Robiginitomaculum sp.]